MPLPPYLGGSVAVSTAPPPIPGDPIDPPPKQTPAKIKELDAKSGSLSAGVGVGFRAYNRFSQSKAPLLAAGTTYYLFLAMFSILAFGYGLAAILGTDEMAAYMTEAIGNAFPGLLGDKGINPSQLRAIGQATSLVGLIGLVYGGGGAVGAAMQSIHLIYGAPADPRNFLLAKVRQLLWLAAIGPLILLSFAASAFTADASDKVLSTIGINNAGTGIVLRVVTLLLTLLVNFAIVYLLLSHFGGIRPPRHALVVGSATGAVVFEVLKLLMAGLIRFTVDKPQYGALAAPIGILFVLFLQCLTLYLMASLTAGVADKDVPLEALAVRSVDEVQTSMAEVSTTPETASAPTGTSTSTNGETTN